MDRTERIDHLLKAIPSLSDYRLQIICQIVDVFALAKNYTRLESSDIISPTLLADFGDVLCLHHCFSREPFSKDKFEHALERVMVSAGTDAALAARGQRGFDIVIDGENFSLKTEAAKGIRADKIHISKFMELGGGQWGSDISDLEGLRRQFLAALKRIGRILILRSLRRGTPDFCYELVEVPTALLQKAETGRLEMRLESRQFPRPGYCLIDEPGHEKFCLYFDGGGERKLQIKSIPKSLCVVHATWIFNPPSSSGEEIG